MTIDRHTGPLPGYAGPASGPASDLGARFGTGHPQADLGGGAQHITVSLPAVKTILMFTAGIVISVVLSVIATITLISVMNAGVILPGYTRVNQPTQVSQLGFCVSQTGAVWTPKHQNFCSGGKFIHVDPKLTGP